MMSIPEPASSANGKAALIARLNKLEGQVRGVRRMVEEGRPWAETVQQIASLRAAAAAIGLVLLEAHLRDSLSSAASAGQREDVAAEAAQALRQYVRS